MEQRYRCPGGRASFFSASNAAARWRTANGAHCERKGLTELSYGDADSDNLDALKALLPYYAGWLTCIAIDPPSNSSKP
jgi:hypothetical protein